MRPEETDLLKLSLELAREISIVIRFRGRGRALSSAGLLAAHPMFSAYARAPRAVVFREFLSACRAAAASSLVDLLADRRALRRPPIRVLCSACVGRRERSTVLRRCDRRDAMGWCI